MTVVGQANRLIGNDADYIGLWHADTTDGNMSVRGLCRRRWLLQRRNRSPQLRGG